jgi:hypothetical protein
MKYVRIRNNSREFLASVYQGQAVRFEPAGQVGCVRDLLPDVAEKVLRDLGDKVAILEPGKSADLTPDKFYGDSMWLANLTGDPDAPEKVPVGQRENKVTGQMEELLAPNPKASPQHISEHMGQVEKFVSKQGVTFTTTIPTPAVNLAPYERIKVPKAIAKTVLLRDRSRGVHAGLVIEARPPLPNDPSMDWDLEKLNAYFMLIEPTALAFGELVTEDSLRAKHPGQAAFELALYDAKFKMWSRCYLRAVNPRYSPPTTEDINLFLRGNAPAPDAVDALLEAKLSKVAKAKAKELSE